MTNFQTIDSKPDIAPRLSNRPDMLRREGQWSAVFAYHPSTVELARADGIYLYDRDDNRYIDATGGPMGVNLPHGHPRIAKVVERQLADYAYCHPLLADPLRAALCNTLARIAPGNLNQCYIASGGSEAVETAIKIARQYHVETGRAAKHKIVSFYESYHGMTLATMSLAGSPGHRRTFDPMMPGWPKTYQYSDLERPAHLSRDEWGLACAERVRDTILSESPETVAALIATPVGAGREYGVVAPAIYWQTVRQICDEYEVLLILDEVVTGFGRTGRWFASEHFGIVPDLMTMGKGMSSLVVPLSGVMISDRVAAPFDAGASFYHGFTGAFNSLAAAVGAEVIAIIEDERLIENVRLSGARLFAGRDRLMARSSVSDVRGAGLLMVVELVKDKASGDFYPPEAGAEALLQSIGLSNGLAIFGTLFGSRRLTGRGLPTRICPPFSITLDQIDDLLDRLDATLSEWEAALA